MKASWCQLSKFKEELLSAFCFVWKYLGLFLFTSSKNQIEVLMEFCTVSFAQDQIQIRDPLARKGVW